MGKWKYKMIDVSCHSKRRKISAKKLMFQTVVHVGCIGKEVKSRKDNSKRSLNKVKTILLAGYDTENICKLVKSGLNSSTFKAQKGNFKIRSIVLWKYH